MLQLSDSQVAIHLCTFQAYFQKAKVNLRFPSLFFVEWKTINGKNAVTMVGRKRAVNSLIELDEALNFTTEMLYHRAQKQYLKKESLIHLNLISHSRPDQVKLVGRVVVDLAEIANSRNFESVATCKLMYCSVDADISFRAKLTRSLDSNLQLNELDRSSFSDLYSFTNNKNPHKNRIDHKDSLSDKRIEDDKRRAKPKGSDKDDPTNKMRNSVKDSKIDNILIKEHAEEQPEDRSYQPSMPHSLPLSERKPPFHLTNPFHPVPPAPPARPNLQSSPLDSRSQPADANLEAVIQKEKEILEKELNEHKNRIRKLETDIKEVMRLFQQSEQKSELNKSKLVQSETILNQIHDKHQQEVDSLKDLHSKELELLKKGYDADIKILQGTIEEQRLRSQDIAQRNQKIIDDFGQLSKENDDMRAQLKEKDQFAAELADIKKQSNQFLQEKQSILDEFTKKQEEITHLRMANAELSQQTADQTIRLDQLSAQVAQMTADLRSKTAQIQSLSAQLANTALSAQKTVSKDQDNTSKLAENTSIMAEQAAALAERSARIEQQNKIINEQTAKIQELSSKNLQATANVADLTAKLNTLTTQYSDLQASVQQEQSKLQQQLEEYKLNLSSTKEEYQQRYDQALKELSQVQEENSRLAEASSKNMNTPLISINEEINKASRLREEEINRIKEENQRLSQEVEELKKTVAAPVGTDVNQAVLQSKEEQERLKNEILNLMEKSRLVILQLEEAKKENTNLSAKMDQLVVEYQQLKTAAVKEQPLPLPPFPEADNKIIEKEVEVELLKEELKKEKQAKEQETAIWQDLENKITELKAEIATLKSEVEFHEALKQELEFCKETINTLSTENQDLRTKNSNYLKITLSPAPQVLQVVPETPVSDPIKIEEPTETIPVQVQTCPPDERRPDTADIQAETSPIPVTLHLERSLDNSSGEAFEEPYNYNFDQHHPLTHEDVNQISEIKGFHHHEEEINALKEENYKLKEEMEEIKSEHLVKQSELKAQIEGSQSKIQQDILNFEETIKKLEREKETIKQEMTREVTALQDRINQLSTVPSAPKEETQPIINIEELLHEIEVYKRQNAELDNTLKQVRSKHEQLEKQSKLYEQHSSNERENALLKELEYRLSNLEEELKIKDELLAETERNIEENYAVKYELAELKEKYSEIKSALDQRDDMINYLEETKEQLSKELQIVAERSHHTESYAQPITIVEQAPVQTSPPEPTNNGQIAELKQEVEALRGELINLNNRNSELIANCQDATNQRNEIERANQELKSIINEAEAAMKELSSLKEAQQQLDKQTSSVTVQLQVEKSKIAEELAAKDVTLKLIGEEIALKELKILELGEASTTLRQEVDQLSSKNNELTAQIEALRQENLQKTTDISERYGVIQQDFQSLSSRLEQANQKIATLEAQNLSLQANNTKLTDQIATLNQQNSSAQLTEQINTLQQQNNTLRTINAELAEQNVNFHHENQKITSRNNETELKGAALKQQLDSITAKYSEVCERVAALQQERDQLQAKNVQLVESLSSIEGHSTHLIEELKSLQLKMQEINDNESKLVVIDAELQQAYAKVESSSKQLQEANAKAAEASGELVRLQAVVQRLSQENQQSIEDKNQQQMEEKNLSLNSQETPKIQVPNQQMENLEMPMYEIHEVESNINEALPIEYENSSIPFMYNASAESIEREENLRKENQSLRQEVEKLLKEVGLLEEFKFANFSEKEALKDKILDLEHQIGFLKEQNDKMTALPLQSFNHTPRRNYPHSTDTLHSQQAPRQTSIMLKQNVKAELQPTKVETNQLLSEKQSQATRLLSESEHELLKKEYEILKEELASEVKLHTELQEIHNICEKKFNVLNAQYLNCSEQLEFYHSENENLIRYKDGLEQELLHFKDKCASQEENIIKLEGDLQKAPEQIIKEEITKQPQQKANESASAINSQKEQYEQKIAQLIKSLEQTINKSALLQQNISHLEKSLQEQIQINQTNDKVAEKLEALSDLQSMALNFHTEIEELKRENEQLHRIKQQYQNLVGEKVELIKIAEEHALCQQEKAEWQQKLDRIEVILSEKEHRYSNERQELESRVSELQEEKTQLEARQSVLMEKPKEELNIAELKQNEEKLRNENEQLRTDRLNELEHITNLEEKINKLAQSQSLKELELTEALTLREQEVEEFRFINQQLKQEIQDLKAAYKELSQQADSHKSSSEEHRLKYEQTLSEVEKARQDKDEKMAQTNTEYQLQVDSLKEQLKVVEEERNQITMEMSAELDKMQIELAEKINAMAEMERNIASYQYEINCVKSELESKLESVKAAEEGTKVVGDELSQLKVKVSELSAKKAQLQSEVNLMNLKNKEQERKLDNTLKLSELKDKTLESFKNDLKKRQKEFGEFTQKIKAKQAEIQKLTKETDQWKAQSQRNQTKIRLLAEKELSMKETMIIVEAESRKLIQSLKNRSESEEGYYRRYLEKEKECNRLSVAAAEVKEEVANKDRMITFHQEKADQLKNELQLAKRGAGAEISPKIVTIQYEKYEKLMQSNDQLMNKNREYLELLSSKSSISVENEHLKGEAKLINAKINEITSNYNQLKQEHDSKIADLTSKLEKANNDIAQLVEERTKKIEQHTATYDKIIAEKEAEIGTVRKSLLELKEKAGEESKIFALTPDSTISILNEQVLSLTQQMLEKDDEICKLRGENQQLKSAVQNNQNMQPIESVNNLDVQPIGEEFWELKKKEEEYKSIIANLEAQLSAFPQPAKLTSVSGDTPAQPSQPILTVSAPIRIEGQTPAEQPPTPPQPAQPQISIASNPSSTHIAANYQNMGLITQDLHHICNEIKQLCKTRTNTPESQTIFQAFIHKYDLIEEQFNNLNNETSCIQEKAKFISKQLQKVKSYVIKSPTRAFKEKTELLTLIKPCENAVNELVNLSQTLSERDSQSFA